MADKKGEKEIVEILSAMDNYLIKDNHNFHNSPKMGYCGACEAFVLIGGDYTVHAGNDCLGAHYETVEHPDQCKKCNSTGFTVVSPEDIGDMKRYGTDVVIKAIENGVKMMGFPSLYCEELPQVYSRWKKLPKKEKVRQINSLFRKNKRIADARKRLSELEASVGAEI